jgi:cytidine deaminase
MIDSRIISIGDMLIQKRKAQNNASGFVSLTNSNHMCAILKDYEPISYGTNMYTVNDVSTEHAEAQALRKLTERLGRRNIAKKITIDVLVIRTNGGNSKPCERCINNMAAYTTRFNIRNIYYTHPKEEFGIRCIKFTKLMNEKPHICSFDRNLRRQNNSNSGRQNNSNKNIIIRNT